MSDSPAPDPGRPPRLSEAALGRLLPSGDRGPVLGDLAEEFAHRARSGKGAARWWYRRQVVRSVLPAIGRRVRSGERYGRVGNGTGTSRGRFHFLPSRTDVKLAGRMLFRRPGLTLAAVFALAVGIPAGMAPIHLFDAFQAPIPEDPEDRIRAIRLWDAEAGRQQWPTYYEFAMWRDALTSFEGVAAAGPRQYNLALADGNAGPVSGAEMSANAFDILATPPLLGRSIIPGDEEPGAPNVVVLGEGLWQARFGADPDVVGSALRLGREDFTVVGVMPERFRFPDAQQLWTALRREASPEPGTGLPLRVFGPLADGANTTRADAEVVAFGERFLAEHPDRFDRLRSEVVPFGIAALYLQGGGPGGLIQLYVFQAFCLVLLLIACTNVAMLTFARTTTRIREMSIRTALGATRSRILSQMFVESLVLAVVAVGIGLVSFQLILERVRRSMAAGPSINIELMPYWFDLSVSGRTVLLGLGWAVVSAAVVSLVPAIMATKKSIRTTIERDRARRSGSRFGGLTSGLIALDVAVTVAAIGAAVGLGGRVVSSFDAAERVGIAAAEFLEARIAIPQEALPFVADSLEAEALRTARLASLQQELEDRLAVEPDVRGVGFASHLPRMDHDVLSVEVEGGATGAPGSVAEEVARRVNVAHVDTEYFAGLGQPIRTGRGFDQGDLGENVRTVIVDTNFADRLLGGRNPIGQRIRTRETGVDDPSEWYEIVGVVGPLGANLAEPEYDAAVYIPARPGELTPMRLAVHVDGDPNRFVPRLRTIVSEVDPDAVVTEALPLNRVFQGAWYGSLMLSIGMIPGIIILIALSTCGIYALVSFAVSERTREIGVRTALGAGKGSIVTRITRRSLAQVGGGALLGLPLATFGMMRLGGGATASIGLASAAALGVTVVICGLALLAPTRRALRIQPTEALRAEG